MEWLREEVGNGLQALLSLRLRSTPAADMITCTADIWVQAFERKLGKHAVQEVDAPRIREAFSVLFPKIREWPAPADVLESMPPRPKREALPEPVISEEERQANVARVKSLMSELFREWENREKGGKP